MIDLVAVRLGKEYLAKHGISTEHGVQVQQSLQVLNDRQSGTAAAAAVVAPRASSSSRRQEDVERGSTLSGTASNDDGEISSVVTAPLPETKVTDYWTDQSENTPPGAQILGVAILEFGILFHSVRLAFFLVHILVRRQRDMTEHRHR